MSIRKRVGREQFFNEQVEILNWRKICPDLPRTEMFIIKWKREHKKGYPEKGAWRGGKKPREHDL